MHAGENNERKIVLRQRWMIFSILAIGYAIVYPLYLDSRRRSFRDIRFKNINKSFFDDILTEGKR